MPSEDIQQIRKECDLATRLWDRMFAAITCITYRELGEAALKQLWFDMLSGHQASHYNEGLARLGIEGDPPAVAAAKYHYFTNKIGERQMQYVEESPQKVWIRYMAPVWMHDGVSLLALPKSIRRMVLTVWHPRNGEMMGCRRLGYVATKFITEGDPYDEGYFIEHDRELLPSETLRFERVERSPEFDPAKAPDLDPDLWPEARLLKAKRNFARDYVRTAADALYKEHGYDVMCSIIKQSMHGMAIQFIHEIRDLTGIAASDARSIRDMFAMILRSCKLEHTVEEVGPGVDRIILKSFLPFAEDAPEELRDAMFRFYSMGTRLLSGRVRISRQRAADGSDIWNFQDAAEWLW